ncbi:hypothetical protein MIND_00889200 [Mycena indigotica]|uniref:Uncharacterized protein n=1 Tax=Mycena indigotica TaxID=2126181 RepID=A0A8H6SIS2_9AGAR|nr:uncharacterized protein MIND_00889200 [Mycena indigotica]KAF7299396.1 hypothetical protein MIND_00889200 [Mycena indigotica]
MPLQNLINQVLNRDCRNPHSQTLPLQTPQERVNNAIAQAHFDWLPLLPDAIWDSLDDPLNVNILGNNQIRGDAIVAECVATLQAQLYPQSLAAERKTARVTLLSNATFHALLCAFGVSEQPFRKEKADAFEVYVSALGRYNWELANEWIGYVFTGLIHTVMARRRGEKRKASKEDDIMCQCKRRREH